MEEGHSTKKCETLGRIVSPYVSVYLLGTYLLTCGEKYSEMGELSTRMSGIIGGGGAGEVADMQVVDANNDGDAERYASV